MSKIRTYADLEQEEIRLQGRLKSQEALVRKDILSMQENLEPVKKMFNTAQKILTRDNRVPFFNVGLELGIDLLLRRFLLVRAGWFAKTFVPYIVKNYSSHIVGEEKRKAIIEKVRSMFDKIRPKVSKRRAPAKPSPNP